MQRTSTRSVLRAVLGNHGALRRIGPPAGRRGVSQGTRILANGSRTRCFVDTVPSDAKIQNRRQSAPQSTERPGLQLRTFTTTAATSGAGEDKLRADEPILGRPRNASRLWLEPSLPLRERVDRYMARELGTLHPMDVVISSVDIIRECGKLRSFEGMQLAQDILDRLLEEKRYVNSNRLRTPGARPAVVPERVFRVLMYGWSNQCRRVKVAPVRMREVFASMIQEHEYDARISKQFASTSVETKAEGNIDDAIYEGLSCQPTVDSCNTLIQGLAEASYRSFNAATEAEAVLRRMRRMNNAREWHTKPTTKSYVLVINAYARTNHRTCGDRAQALLLQMARVHEEEKERYRQQFGIEYDVQNPQRNRRRIVTPNATAYSSTINAHTKSGTKDYADKILSLLLEMIQSNKPYAAPDYVVFTNAINAFAELAGRLRFPKSRLAAANRAEEILHLMIDEIKHDQRNGTDRPSHTLAGHVEPFNACIKAWAKSGLPEAPSRAQMVLQIMSDASQRQLIGAVPNTVSFNLVLQAWASTAERNPEATRKAEELLRVMISQRHDPLQTIGGGLRDAEADQTGGNRTAGSSQDSKIDIRPDVQSYVIVMNAYSRSLHPNKTARARQILVELISKFRNQDDVELSSIPFTVVLTAAVHSEQVGTPGDSVDEFGLHDEGNDDPYEIALQTYHEVQNDLYELGVAPDHVTYAAMLKVIGQHTSESSVERKQRVKTVFYDACEAGQVSSLVVRALRRVCDTARTVQELLQTKLPVEEVDTVGMLPAAWTSHVPPTHRRLREDSRKKRSRRANERKSKD